MSGILSKVRSFSDHFPLFRGMVSYAIIWPTCSIVQEYLEHSKSLHEADMVRAARFGFFGTFFMAPVFYGWMKYTSRFFKSKSFKTAVVRAAIEQVSYSPLAMAYFFFGMSLLEFKSVSTCVSEVKEKFWPTYKIGVIFWPTAQTLNFYFISEKNRIIFVSAASFVWTVYLAHMKGKHTQKSIPGIKDDASDPAAPDRLKQLSSDSEMVRPVLKETSSESGDTLARKLAPHSPETSEQNIIPSISKTSYNQNAKLIPVTADSTSKGFSKTEREDANSQANETKKIFHSTLIEESGKENELDTEFGILDTETPLNNIDNFDASEMSELETVPENTTSKEYLSSLLIGI